MDDNEAKKGEPQHAGKKKKKMGKSLRRLVRRTEDLLGWPGIDDAERELERTLCSNRGSR